MVMLFIMVVLLALSAAALGVRLLLGDVGVANEEDIPTTAGKTDMDRIRPASVYVVELPIVLTLTHGVCFPHLLLNGVAFLSGATLGYQHQPIIKNYVTYDGQHIFLCRR